MDTRKAEAAVNVTEALMALDGEYRAVGKLAHHEQAARDNPVHYSWGDDGWVIGDTYQSVALGAKLKKVKEALYV